jgi:hypothetical protein
MNHIVLGEVLQGFLKHIFNIKDLNTLINLPNITLKCSIPGLFDLLTLVHALILCYSIRHKLGGKSFPLPPIQAILTVWFMGVGGTSMAYILLGKTPTFLTSNTGILTYSFVAVLMFYIPGLYELINTLRFIIVPLLTILDGFSLMFAITNTIDVAIATLKGPDLPYLPLLLLGALAGCGGGILGDSFGLLKEPFDGSFAIPSSFKTRAGDLSILLPTLISSLYLTLLYSMYKVPVKTAKNILGWILAGFSLLQFVKDLTVSKPKKSRKSKTE